MRLRGVAGWPASTLPVRQQLVPRPLLRATRLPGTVTRTVLGRIRSGNRSEPLESRAAVTQTRYTDAVDAKVAEAADRIKAGRQVDGWALGPARICQEAADEAVDIAGWLRGLEQHELPPRAAELVDVITGDAALIWDAIQELGRLYGPSE